MDRATFSHTAALPLARSNGCADRCTCHYLSGPKTSFNPACAVSASLSGLSFRPAAMRAASPIVSSIFPKSLSAAASTFRYASRMQFWRYFIAKELLQFVQNFRENFDRVVYVQQVLRSVFVVALRMNENLLCHGTFGRVRGLLRNQQKLKT